MRGSPYQYDAEKKEFVMRPPEGDSPGVPAPVGEGLLGVAHRSNRHETRRRRKYWVACAVLLALWVILVLAGRRSLSTVPAPLPARPPVPLEEEQGIPPAR